MRTYKILQARARQWNADPEVQELLAATSPEALVPAYSRATADALKAQTFRRDALGAAGLAYERLDQLTVEILLGARG
jgi:xylose isomerase